MIYTQDEIQNILLSVAKARAPLTDDDIQILSAIAQAFGLRIDFRLYQHRQGYIKDG